MTTVNGGPVGGGGGGIKTVGLTLPAIFSVSGSPLTKPGGTITATLATQVANRVWAGPSTGADATPTFRALVAADIPALDTSKLTTGTLDAARMPALTGDITTVAGAVATTLATVNSNVGSFALATVTVNAKGLITAVSAASTTGSGNVVLATSPTIVTPFIASFVNATHTHQDAAGGGQLNASSVFSAGTVPLARGGTNVDLSATGGSTSFLAQDASHVVSARTIASADLVTALTTPPAIGGTTPAAGTFNGLTLTGATPSLALNGATSNVAIWATNGVGAPAFTTRSAGTKLVLYPQLDGTHADFAIGIASGELWLGTSQAIGSSSVSFYGGTTRIARIRQSATNTSEITWDGTVANWMNFGTVGVGAPTLTTRSAGTKVIVYNNLSASDVDYAEGIEANNMWYSVPNTASGYKWYAGTTQILRLTSTALFSASGVFAPNSDSTTALKLAKADGTAVVTVDTTNGQVGIGTTPAAALHVVNGSAPVIRVDDNGGSNAAFFGFVSDIGVISVNRNFATGTFINSGRTAPQINLVSGSSDSSIVFYTTASNNAVPSIRTTIDKNGVLTQTATDAVTAAVTPVAIFDHTGGTTAAGFGTSALWKGKSSSQSRELVDLQGIYNSPTDASYTTYGLLRAYYMSAGTPTARNAIGWGATGSAALIGFLAVAAAPVALQTTYTQTYTTTTSTVNPASTSAFTGQDNLQVGNSYAKVADLNTLRGDMLMAMQLLNQLIDNAQAYGLAA